ncbi:MAG: YIP1 family protein [Bacteroidetes bacterium]|nr:MAG: YIP1 family protein [Bacteroidota bacterium]
MNIFERARRIIVSPNSEWDVIAVERPDTSKILNYVMVLAGLASIAAFIGYGFVGFHYGMFGHIATIEWGIYYALRILIGAIAGVFLSAIVVDALAPSFGSEKNIGRSVQLIAYSYTPFWIGSLLAIYPPLAIIGALAGIYGLYLTYLGMPRMKKTPADKHAGYFVVWIVVLILVYAIISLVIRGILLSAMGLTYGLERPGL